MEDNIKTVTVRLTDAQHFGLKQSAESVGMTISDYVRSIASDGMTVVAYDPAMTDAILTVHEDVHSVADELQKISTKNPEDLALTAAVRDAVTELLAINQSLTLIVESLEVSAQKVGAC